MTTQTKIPEWIFYPLWVHQHQLPIKKMMRELKLDADDTFEFEDFAMQMYFLSPDMVEERLN